MKVSLNGRSLHLPDFIIAGAAKSGTTTLAYYLKQHPQVVMPRKEPGFFSYHNRPQEEIPSGIRDRQIVDLDEFTNLYKSTPDGKFICDASTAYLTNYQHTIQNIRNLYGEQANDIKFTIILRNPVERAFSHYLMFLKNGLEEFSFEEAIAPDIVNSRKQIQLGYDYLGNSLYYERTKAFVDAFPQVKIYLMEDLKNSQMLIQDYFNFLNIKNDVHINTTLKLNPSGVPKNSGVISRLHKRTKFKEFLKKVLPDKIQFRLIAAKSALIEQNIERVQIEAALKQRLINDYFSEDIQKLETLLGRDLTGWLAK